MAATDLGIDHLTDVSIIGQGGFSVVYSARHTLFKRKMAVKLLNPLTKDSERMRFERECEVMGRLSDHPNVVSVYNAGYTSEDRPYLLMELVEGGTLQDRLERERRIPWPEAVSTLLPICEALQAAHDESILHRDVKPENILMAGDGEPRLADFGIASLRDATGATSTHVTASMLHTPPETFENTRDERSDIYSLASTLYATIVGRAPFWQDTDQSIHPLMNRLLNDPAPAIPAELAPPELSLLVQRALAKDPHHRPQTGDDFSRELRGVLGGRGTGGASRAEPSPVDSSDTVIDNTPMPRPAPSAPVAPVRRDDQVFTADTHIEDPRSSPVVTPQPAPQPFTPPQPGPFTGPQPGPFTGPQPGPFTGPQARPGPQPGPQSYTGPQSQPGPQSFTGPHSQPVPPAAAPSEPEVLQGSMTPGWYHATGDPFGTQRFWNGAQWQGNPQPVGAQSAPIGVSGTVGHVPGAIASAERRLIARFADYCIWFVFWLIAIFMFIDTSDDVDGAASYAEILLTGLFTTALIVAYEIVMVAAAGATLGKLLLNLRVVNSEDGSPAEFTHAAMRMLMFALLSIASSLVYLPILIMLVITGVGIAALFSNDRRQTMWDRQAKTVVVQR